MGIQPDISPEKLSGNKLLLQPTPASAPTSSKTERWLTEEATERKDRVSQTPSDFPGEGRLLCVTDLMRRSSCRERPRLLPAHIKMYVYINRKSRKSRHNPYCTCSQLSPNGAERDAQWGREHLESKGTNTLSMVHPKKKFLHRFHQDWKYCSKEL